MRSVGIDIGSSSIKIVVLQQTNKGLNLSEFIEHPLPQTPGFDPELEILEFLRSTLPRYKTKNTKFVFGLPLDQTSVRLKTFPFTEKLKIFKSLPFELEEELPFPAEQAIFDAKVVEQVGNQTTVLAVAAPKAKIEKFLSFIKDVGVEASILSIDGFAFSNCFENWDLAPSSSSTSAPSPSVGENSSAAPVKKLHGVLYLGHGKSQLALFSNGSLTNVKSLSFGGKSIIDAVARKYELPFSEAMKEVEQKGFVLLNRANASYDQITFSETISSSFKDFLRELKMTLLEAQSELGTPVSELFITGGVSGLIHLNAFLTQGLEIPVNPVEVLQKFPLSQIEKSPNTDRRIGLALGLAIEGFKKPRNPPINLMKGEFAIETHPLSEYWNAWGVPTQAFLAMIAVSFVYTSFREDFATRLNDKATDTLKSVAKTVAQLPPKQANSNGVKKYIRDQNKKIKEMESLEGAASMNSALDLLKKVHEVAPPRNTFQNGIQKTNSTLVLNKFFVEDRQVLIEGKASSIAEIQNFESALKSLASNGKVTRISEPKVQGAQVAFSLQLAVDRLPSKERQ